MADETPQVESEDFTEDLTTEAWSADPAGPSLVGRLVAEAIGTFVLVLIGTGTALLLSVTGNGTIAVGFGFGVAAMIGIVAFGRVSGAHFNPALTIGAWLSGRFPGLDVVPYILAQVVGGIVAGGALRLGIGSLDGVDGTAASGLMSTVSIGFGEHAPFASSGLTFGVGVALMVEAIATGLLMLVVLGATSKKVSPSVAPFAIGLGLAVLVVWTIPFTNGALNPARATATALFSDTWALGQLWAWWLAPIVGAAIVGLLYRIYGPVEDLEATEEIIED